MVPTSVPQVFPGEIDGLPATYLNHLGTIFTRFTTQDSRNISYRVQTAARKYFVKTAGDPADSTSYLDFDGRVALLRNAAALAESVVHPTVPALHAFIESPAGPLLVYDWRSGEHLGTDRDNPSNAHQRFRARPPRSWLPWTASTTCTPSSTRPAGSKATSTTAPCSTTSTPTN